MVQGDTQLTPYGLVKQWRTAVVAAIVVAVAMAVVAAVATAVLRVRLYKNMTSKINK